MKKQAVVLLSGGLDSSTLLARTVERHGFREVAALCILYGQRHERELQSARAIAEHYKVELFQLDLSEVFKNSSSSLLVSSDEEIPKDSYAAQLAEEETGLVSTYVPFRNGLFLSAAASFALSCDARVLSYGAHRDDWAGSAYPDCSEAFVGAMQAAISEGTGGALQLEVPYLHQSKAQIVEEGLLLGVPYELTWSCYEGKETPCGECATCLDRAAAFKENGVEDPLLAC